MDVFTAQAQVDQGGIFISSWSLSLIGGICVLLILPWMVWATNMIFDFKRFQALSNSTEKNIFEKLEDLEETIRVNNIEIKDQIKDLNSTLNVFIADEFQFMKKLMKGQKNAE
jgi:hypothetical protein